MAYYNPPNSRNGEVNTIFNIVDYSSQNSENISGCLLYTSPSPRDLSTSRMPSSA